MKLSRRLETYRKSRSGYSKRLRKTLILFPTYELFFRHTVTPPPFQRMLLFPSLFFVALLLTRSLLERLIKLHIYNRG